MKQATFSEIRLLRKPGRAVVFITFPGRSLTHDVLARRLHDRLAAEFGRRKRHHFEDKCLSASCRGVAFMCNASAGSRSLIQMSRPTFAANAVRLQLHALAYNIGNFMRTLAMPKTAETWSLTNLKEKLIKIGPGSSAMGAMSLFSWLDRGAATDVRRHPVAARPAAGTTSANAASDYSGGAS